MRVQTREIVCAVRAVLVNTVSVVPAELIYTNGNAAGESDGSTWAGAFNRLHDAPAAARTGGRLRSHYCRRVSMSRVRGSSSWATRRQNVLNFLAVKETKNGTQSIYSS
jgi:hypothetical protein